jgi:hypothetical protein
MLGYIAFGLSSYGGGESSSTSSPSTTTGGSPVDGSTSSAAATVASAPAAAFPFHVNGRKYNMVQIDRLCLLPALRGNRGAKEVNKTPVLGFQLKCSSSSRVDPCFCFCFFLFPDLVATQRCVPRRRPPCAHQDCVGISTSQFQPMRAA